MNLSLKIALRYLRSKKAHSAVNIISAISVCGVVVATAALVCVLSVFNGFSQLINGKLAVLDPDIAITAASGKSITDADSVLSAVNDIAGIDLAMPVITDQALAVFSSFQMPVKIKGVPHNYNLLTDVDKSIIDGQFLLSDGTKRYAVIGVIPAITLNTRPGFEQKIKLFAPQRSGRINVANPAAAFTADSLLTAGVFQIEQAKYDRDLMFVPIEMARKLFNYTTQATSIEVRLNTDANEQSVISAIEKALGHSYEVKNRLMQESDAFRMINIEKWVSFLLLAFILIIATFNVIGALSLLIIEKRESIATFRNFGATDKQIQNIFVMEGWVISLTGAVAGVIIGLILCSLQEHFGLITMQGNTANLIVESYPVVVQWSDVLIVFALVAAVGLFTSFITSLIMRRLLKS